MRATTVHIVNVFHAPAPPPTVVTPEQSLCYRSASPHSARAYQHPLHLRSASCALRLSLRSAFDPTTWHRPIRHRLDRKVKSRPDIYFEMPSCRTKQIRRSKGNVQYHQRRAGDAQARIGQAVASNTQAAATDETQRVAAQGGVGASSSASAQASASNPSADEDQVTASQPTASVQPSANVQQPVAASPRARRREDILARVNHTVIEKVMAGDGSTINEREFPVNDFFAASSWQNDLSSFYPIQMSSYRSPAWKNASFTVRAETEAAKRNTRLPLPPAPGIHKGNYKRATTIIRNAIQAWCLANTGYSVMKRGPGVRGKSSVASLHFVDSTSTVFERGQKGTCLQSAFVNAFERLSGAALANKVRDDIKKHKGPLNSIGHAQRAIQKAAPGFNFRKLQDPEFLSDKIKWLGAVKKGV